eukprot:854747-Pleurochrysis_carterae.AAC.2
MGDRIVSASSSCFSKRVRCASGESSRSAALDPLPAVDKRSKSSRPASWIAKQASRRAAGTAPSWSIETSTPV